MVEFVDIVLILSVPGALYILNIVTMVILYKMLKNKCHKYGKPNRGSGSREPVPMPPGDSTSAEKSNSTKEVRITPLSDKPIEPQSLNSKSSQKSTQSPPMPVPLSKPIQDTPKPATKASTAIASTQKSVAGKAPTPFVAPITGITPKKAKGKLPGSSISASISPPSSSTPPGSTSPSPSPKSRIPSGRVKKLAGSAVSVASQAFRKSEIKPPQSKTTPPASQSKATPQASPGSPTRSTEADRERREKTLEKKLLDDKVQQALRKRKERMKGRRNKTPHEPLYDPTFKASVEMLETTRKHLSLINEMQESLSKTKAVSKQSQFDSKAETKSTKASSAVPPTPTLPQASTATSKKTAETSSAQPSTAPSAQPSSPTSAQPSAAPSAQPSAPPSTVPSSAPNSTSPPVSTGSPPPSTGSPPPSSASTTTGSTVPATPPPSKQASAAAVQGSLVTKSARSDESDTEE